MNIFMRFPQGKSKALTLSYDDGVIQDKRFVDIINPYGIKATFNVNSGTFSKTDAVDSGRVSVKQAKEIYKGHEVAVHSLTHPYLDKLPLHIAVDEVLRDRKNLEEIFGTVVRGMAYPFGTYNDALVEALKNIDIAYSRTVISTRDFSIPSDWLRLPATCHHRDPALFELTEKFINAKPEEEKYRRGPMLFYVWGHTYEFDEFDNWDLLENFAQRIGGREDIWYATNIEIYDYVKAYKNLKFSVDASCVYNPSGFTVWFEKDRKQYFVEPNETKSIK